MDIFKQAARENLRFSTIKGQLSVEDLFNLSLKRTNDSRLLKSLIKDLYEKVKKKDELSSELSFLESSNPTSKEESLDKLRYDVSVDVFKTMKVELDEEKKKANDKEHNEKILNLIAQKQDEQLKEASIEELKAQLR